MNRLILLALLLFSVPAWATQYYVSNTGSDSANGLTLGTAWLTIGHANSTLVAGDTVDIVAGSYPESITKGNSGSAGLPITYEAYQGGTVIMDGSETPAGWTLDTGSIYKVTSWSPPYAGFVWQDNYTFLTSEASEGAMIAGSWYYNAGTSTLYVWATDSANPATHTINASWLKVAWYSGADSTNTAKSYITLRGLTIRFYGRAVDAEAGYTSNNWDLESLDVSFAPDEAIWIMGGGASSANWTVNNSNVHQNHGHGIQDNGNNTTITHNTLSYNEFGGAYTNGGAGAILSGSNTGSVVEYNTFSNNGTAYGPGLIIETTAVQNCTVEFNDFYGNRDGGIAFTGGQNCTVAYNQIHDNWRGGSISTAAAISTVTGVVAPTGPSTNNHIYGNTFNNNYGGFYTDSASGSGLVLKNNIFRSAANQTVDMLGTSAVLDYNDYLANTLTMLWNGNSYSTLATFQSASSQDAHSQNVNPIFTSALYGWDGFENWGLTSAGNGGWWSTGSATTATIATSSTQVHSGLFSAKVAWTGTSQNARVYNTVPASNTACEQYALNVTAMAGGTANTDGLNYTFTPRAAPIIVYASASTYKLNLPLTTSSGTTTLTGTTVLNMGTWYTVEFCYIANSATVGGGELWINGTPEVSNFTLNTTEANAAPTRTYVGLNNSASGATSGTIYIDDFRYDTAYIGTRAIDNFALGSGSPAIGTGANLDGTYSVGLINGSTWPSGVILGAQGSPWNIGAYVTPGGSALFSLIP